jgi:hypothetical protein
VHRTKLGRRRWKAFARFLTPTKETLNRMQLPLRAAIAMLAFVALTPASASAQQQQYTVGFGWEPKTPTTLDDVTLTATTTAPDVTWDFDADGHPDAAGKSVVHRFATQGDHRVVVRASWPAAVPITRQAVESIHVLAATPTPTPTPTPTATPTPEPTVVAPVPTAVATPSPTPVPCRTSVTIGKLVATSMCFEQHGSTYTTRWPMALNGIFVGPQNGAIIAIDTRGATRITSDNAKVKVTVQGTPLTTSTGKLDWTVSADKLVGFKSTAPSLGGMKITAMPSAPQLLAGGKTRFAFYFALPDKLGGGTPASPVKIDVGGGSDGGFSFKVAHGWLPGLSLSELQVRYDGNASWAVDARVRLPQPVPLDVSGGVAVKNGSFSSLYANTSFGANGPHYGPIALQRLSFALELNPTVSKCVPKIGKEIVDMKGLLKQATGQVFNVPPVVIDHGKPVSALCGEIALTAGPSLLGKPALSLDGGLGLTMFNDRPSVMRAYGKVKLVGWTMSDAELEVHGNGYVGMRSRFDWGWDGLAALRGYSSLEFLGKKFNGEAYMKACLDFVDYCLGAEGLLSSKGVAVCLTVDTWVGDWHPGFGAAWGKSAKLYWSGCDLGPYRENLTASASADSGRPVRLPGGLPGAVIAVTGQGGVPKVAFISPSGKRIETPADLKPVGAPGHFLMQVPNENLTQVALGKPEAGTWHVVALPGSVPIAKVASAQGLAKPSVKATVRAGKLRYEIKTRPGQVVRFIERGPSAAGEIGVARGAHGTLRFTPAAGRAERRDIVALVEQDGALRDRITVAHYRAPGLARPAKVRSVRARRSGSSVVVSWKGARLAEVRASLADGRRLTVRGSSARFARVTRGTFVVRSLSREGRLGAPVTVRVR